MLYPEITPYNTFRLRVSDLHELHVEESGNPGGRPVLVLHGGPGLGLLRGHARYYDPEFYRIILFDQRGAGKSAPHAELRENTTWDLVEDIEKIRRRLNIDRWIVTGGSWGSTLALAYAETHPDAVRGLIIRGVFLLRREELRWFYQFGAHHLFPDYWEDFIRPVPPSARADMIRAYHDLLTGGDEKTRVEAARAWSLWEGRTLNLITNPDMTDLFSDPHIAFSLARIECHYFMNGAFFDSDDYLLKNAFRIQGIPTHIIHGRYDVVTPFKSAWDLKAALPNATLHCVSDAGHAGNEPGIAKKSVECAEAFKTLERFAGA